MMKKLLMLLALLCASPAFAQEPPAYTDGTELADIASNFDTAPLIYSGSPAAAASGAFAQSKFRTACDPSHLAYDDPIVYPNQPGASHLHMFFGNTLTDNASTYTTLRTTGESTCGGGKLNRSGYWMPALLQDGAECDSGHVGTETCARVPDHTVVYYTMATSESSTAKRVPRGMRFVFGFDVNNPVVTAPSGYAIVKYGFEGWKCNSGAGGTQRWLRNTDGTAALACAAGDQLIAVFSGPNCWNGTAITSATGRTHVSNHFRNVASGQNECPPTHPYIIAEFEFQVYYSHNGPTDFKELYLASDRMAGHPTFRNGETAHTDWFGGWDYGDPAGTEGIMLRWMKNCNGTDFDGVGTGTDHSCVFTQFGDGTAGQQAAFVNLGTLSGANRLWALPADPAPVVDPVVGYKVGKAKARRGKRTRH